MIVVGSESKIFITHVHQLRFSCCLAVQVCPDIVDIEVLECYRAEAYVTSYDMLLHISGNLSARLSMNILVADDDELVTKLYRIALESREHTVATASDGRECVDIYKKDLEKVDSDSEPFDVVVMDLRMPSMDGLEAARKILELRPAQRLIFVTAYVRETLSASVRELGRVISILEKPFDAAQLVKVIEDVFTFKDLAELNKLLKRTSRDISSRAQITELHSLLKQIQKSGLS